MFPPPRGQTTMTIFGFNTDVKYGDTVFHVQSEARKSDLLIQTLVFVKGQCIGKRGVSYAEQVSHPDFSDQAIHELLKSQHKTVIDAISEGNIGSVLGSADEIQDVGGTGLSVKCLSVDAGSHESSVTMHLQVTDHGQAVSGAKIVSRLGNSSESQVVAQVTTDAAGAAALQIPLSEETRRESAVLVQATHEGKSATRKFRFKKLP
ncbi:MAG TPA: hypothetical protein VG759_11675 [Candidatus Angelobacter sp.]|nr:hypothetical protein [Candidatus Angelobacter sp.]